MAAELTDVMSEAGIIATILFKPEFTLASDQLKPNHFSDEQNAYIYYAVCELAKRGIEHIDPYGIINILNAKEATKRMADKLTVESLTELIKLSEYIARPTLAEYNVLVKNVVDKAFRRDMMTTLSKCESLCKDDDNDKIQSKIYSEIDTLIAQYYIGQKMEMFGNRVDEMFAKLCAQQNDGGLSGVESKFPIANEYFTYEKGELVLVCAYRKEGKSIYCMNELMDKLSKGYRCLYIDSEMSDEQHYIRFLSLLAGISVKDIKLKRYDADGERRIDAANRWLKSHTYVHYYMTQLDPDQIYFTAKRMMNTVGLDFVIVDYIKSQGSNTSSEIYNMLGSYTDFLKNRIAGELQLPVLAAAQLNRNGEISDSFKIEQFASTVNILRRKSREEVERDGRDCGNYKLFVKLNRLGDQMGDISTDYIDLNFNGARVQFEQADRQHEQADLPY